MTLLQTATEPQVIKPIWIELVDVESKPNESSILTYYTFICDQLVRDNELIEWLVQREKVPANSYLMSERQDKRFSRAVIVKTQFISRQNENRNLSH